MIFNEKIEKMDRAALRKLQGERLRDAVGRAYANVPFYRAKFDAHGVKPADIRTIDDIVKLPFTVKDDFRDQYPFGLFAVPLRDIVRVHASSGTTGKPTVVGYTRADIEIWAENHRAHARLRRRHRR
jgi:phenylacetate-CoA ligase